jgi:hypothetical protein
MALGGWQGSDMTAAGPRPPRRHPPKALGNRRQTIQTTQIFAVLCVRSAFVIVNACTFAIAADGGARAGEGPVRWRIIWFFSNLTRKNQRIIFMIVHLLKLHMRYRV